MPFAFDVESQFLKMLLDLAAVFVVADLEEHFDADACPAGRATSPGGERPR